MYSHLEQYDAIIVGAGHAGCEAALAAARMGCKVLLLTSSLDTIGKMSCNPAIGGIAKGHLVREIDALGGEMARAIDETGIQFRVLNRKKGPAVWACRAQADRGEYQRRMRNAVKTQERLRVVEESVTGILVERGMAHGVACESGNSYGAKVVVVAAGTFLNGVMHIGDKVTPGGREGERAMKKIARNLKDLGFEMGRLKTGTSPRISTRGVDFGRMQRQDGDPQPVPFSFSTKQINCRQLPCYITRTSGETERIIRSNLDRSPLYSGRIKGTGVRYCPSLEDKYVKFPEKRSHQIFIEPEGRETAELYLNGASTSMPYEVQVALVKSIIGLEDAEILRPGYAVEYDFAQPTQLYPWLETKLVRNLFLAGQINGTSGYEEAAAQGLIAGINAALRAKGDVPFTLSRSEAYIGVLIDDLVTKGTTEPYRMFTSRAEYRLFLRQDNADARLMRHGHRLGLVSDETVQRLELKLQQVNNALQMIDGIKCNGRSVAQMLQIPGESYENIRARLVPELPEFPHEVVEQIEIQVKYAGYLDRQMMEIGRFKRMEKMRIPEGFNFGDIVNLKKEAREKLQRIRPVSVGQAARISGITPADISVLLISLEKKRRASRI